MANPPEGFDVYELLRNKAEEVENELRRLNRWQQLPLSSEKFEDKGAYIVLNKNELPADSRPATHAVRLFDSDPDASTLIRLLNEIDEPGKHNS